MKLAHSCAAWVGSLDKSAILCPLQLKANTLKSIQNYFEFVTEIEIFIIIIIFISIVEVDISSIEYFILYIDIFKFVLLKPSYVVLSVEIESKLFISS